MPKAQLPAAQNMVVLRSKRIRGTDREVVQKVRALYQVVYNSEDSLIPLAVELFHALGSILEGTPMRHIDFRLVDKDSILRELKEQGERS